MTTFNHWANWMHRCLQLAKQGQGLTHPNPMVGCVIIDIQGQVLAEGYHQGYGKAHAEVDALSKIPPNTDLSQATLIVNLEPCSHTGKTPPCTEAIIQSGIKQVVYGLSDPNPKVSGQGIQQLKQAGIKLIGPVEEAPCQQLNQAFLHRIQHQTPYTLIKMALTLDGKVATRTGQSQWITHEKSRVFAHQLRAQSDAIISTAKTVITDNASLTVRLSPILGKPPIRIILDRSLSLTPDLNLFKDNAPIWVVCDDTLLNTEKAKQLEQAGATIIGTPTQTAQNNFLDLKSLWAKLSEIGITQLLVEAGPTLCGQLLKEKLAQKLWLQYGPQIIGDQQAPSAFDGLFPKKISQALSTQIQSVQQTENNLLLEIQL